VDIDAISTKVKQEFTAREGRNSEEGRRETASQAANQNRQEDRCITISQRKALGEPHPT
jgi:hypothetical protein